MPLSPSTGRGEKEKLPRHDSNVDYLIQSQACYQLHHRAMHQTKNPEAAGLRGRWFKSVERTSSPGAQHLRLLLDLLVQGALLTG